MGSVSIWGDGEVWKVDRQDGCVTWEYTATEPHNECFKLQIFQIFPYMEYPTTAE